MTTVTRTSTERNTQILRNQLRTAQADLRDARDRHNYALAADIVEEIHDILVALESRPLDGQIALPGVEGEPDTTWTRSMAEHEAEYNARQSGVAS